MEKITKSGFAAIDESEIYVSMRYKGRTEIFKLENKPLRYELAARMIHIVENRKNFKK
jgi:hypothetical protein